MIRFVPSSASAIFASSTGSPCARAARKFRRLISCTTSGQFHPLIRLSHLLGGSFLSYRSRKILKRDIASSAWYRQPLCREALIGIGHEPRSCVCTVSDASRYCVIDSNCSVVGGNRVDGPFRLPLCRYISRRYLRGQNTCQECVQGYPPIARNVQRLTSVPDGPRSKMITPPKILASAQ